MPDVRQVTSLSCWKGSYPRHIRSSSSDARSRREARGIRTEECKQERRDQGGSGPPTQGKPPGLSPEPRHRHTVRHERRDVQDRGTVCGMVCTQGGYSREVQYSPSGYPRCRRGYIPTRGTPLPPATALPGAPTSCYCTARYTSGNTCPVHLWVTPARYTTVGLTSARVTLLGTYLSPGNLPGYIPQPGTPLLPLLTLLRFIIGGEPGFNGSFETSVGITVPRR